MVRLGAPFIMVTRLTAIVQCQNREAPYFLMGGWRPFPILQITALNGILFEKFESVPQCFPQMLGGYHGSTFQVDNGLGNS